MFERFTADARRVVTTAQEHARATGRPHIGTEHLLLGVVCEHDGVGARVLRRLGVDEPAVREQLAAMTVSDADALRALGIDLDAVRRKAEEAFGPGALERAHGEARHGRGGRQRFTPAAKKTLELALREAVALEHGHIGTEHILLGLLWDQDEPAARVLRRLGVDLDRPAMRARVLEELDRAA